MFSSFNLEYELGCDYRDGKGVAVDIEEAIKHFKKAKSFIGYYALGELYQYGFDSSANGQQVSLAPNPAKAAGYYLKASKKRAPLRVQLTNGNTLDAYSDISQLTLQDINYLLSDAKRANPEALYLLAMVYSHEVMQELLPEKKRKISISQIQLEQLVVACLTAAAELYHPQAALLLVTLFSSRLSSEQRLKYSCIAADPFTAMTKSSSGRAYYRGDAPLQTEITLTCGKELPAVLFAQDSITGSSRIAGIHDSSVTRRGSCLLPAMHFAYSGKELKSGSETKPALTQEEMRQARLSRLGLLASPTTTKATQSTHTEATTQPEKKLGPQ